MKTAREADKEKEILTAIRLYEEMLDSGDAELIDYLNLTVIYFNCMDLGYASAHKVGRDIEERASSRALEILDIAEKLFGANDELTFWRVMIPFHGWSEPVPQFSLRGDSDVPYLFLASENPTQYNFEKLRSLEKYTDSIDECERKRYLVGKIHQII